MDGGISSEQGITGLASAARRFSVIWVRPELAALNRVPGLGLKAIIAGISNSSDCATTKARETLSKSIFVKLDRKPFLAATHLK
jgi:hypothetical protein